LLAERNHDLRVELPPQPVHVRGDHSRLSQVVANLLSNAAKYTNECGLISVAVGLDPRTGSQAFIRVSDNGRGFDSAASDKLFDLFYQVERDLDRSEGGLGIGLALVRSLVHLHDGTVEAHSDGTGQGSEFTVRIPCELTVQPAPLTPNRMTETSARRKVLVVDDNHDSASTMGALLKLLGHEIVLAFDGHSALESAVREKPDVILMDIGLPGMSGYEVCRELRASEHSFESIIAMTGYGRDEDRRQSREAGFDKHLVKPVSLNDIQGVMRELAGAP
jgi:CheY-like chemotaxis protein